MRMNLKTIVTNFLILLLVQISNFSVVVNSLQAYHKKDYKSEFKVLYAQMVIRFGGKPNQEIATLCSNLSMMFKWPPFLLESTILVILLVMKHVGKAKKELQFIRAAGPLTGLVLGTTIAKVLHAPSISLVGDIPQGIPKFSFPKSFDHARLLLPTAALITGVAILMHLIYILKREHSLLHDGFSEF
ncbi:unnamed protein product [Thlaspi arvense]|uniref:SLC26A/SulP transporter domain-containing protein n=1 Tax=Thlaspi arvense TaxID=13288 RepID=A0AAU9SG68_THLAR|nr:unnamed protein product [Thlaspi arvense]